MSNLVIDALQAAGVASATVVSIELTDQRGDPVTGFVTDTDQVVVFPTAVTTDVNGQVTVNLIPNSLITPGNTCYTVRIAEKQYLIQKGIGTQNLFDALVSDPGPLDPIETNELIDHINDPVGAHPASAISSDPFLAITADNVQDALEQVYMEAVEGIDEASEISFVPTGDIVATNVQDAIVEVDTEFHAFQTAIQAEVDADEAALAAHLADTTDAHDASAISVVPFSTISSTNVQDALAEVLLESTPAASGVPFTPTGDIVATNVQAAIAEVDAEFHAHEVKTPDAHDASAISYIPANVLDQTNVQDAITELGESFSTPKTPSGFPNLTDTTLAIADVGANLQFTIAPVGASFDVWIFGDKFTKTTETVLMADGLDRVYYIYYSAAGTLSVASNVSQPTGFDWATQVPVAIVFRNATGLDMPLYDTRHGLSMDWATRGYLHNTRGTQIGTGLVLSGYTLSPGSPADADNQWAMSAGTILNEDLTYTIPAVTDNSTYSTVWKNLVGTFATSIGATVPFAISGSDIAYNLNTAGSYSLSPVPNGSFVNYYIFAAGAQTTGYKLFAFPEETTYATLALAQAAAIQSPFTQGGFAFSEFFMRYRVTYQRSNAYTTTGRCRTVAVQQIVNSQTIIAASATPSAHNSLSGRDVADTHPAATITNTPAGLISATDVQSALNELDTEKVPTDGSYAAVSTSVQKTRVTGNVNPRFEALADGTMQFGNGTAVADTNLYRANADELKTDDNLTVGTRLGVGTAATSSARIDLATGTTAADGIRMGTDVNLYRSAANVLKTDDSFTSVFTSANPAGITSGINSTLTSTYSASSAIANTSGVFNQLVTVASGQTLSGNPAAVQFANSTDGAGDVSGSLRGLLAAIGNTGAGTVTTGVGIEIQAPTGTGAITNTTGISVANMGRSGSTNHTGISVAAQTGGSGFRVGASIGVASSITLWVGSTSNSTTAAGGIHFGSSFDTNLYRSAADTLKTDDAFVAASLTTAGVVNALALAVGASPPANGAIRMSNGDNINVAAGNTFNLACGSLAIVGIASGQLNLGENVTMNVGTVNGTTLAGATTQKFSFHGSTPVVQRAGASQAAVSTTAATITTPYGYTTAAQADGVITLLNEIRATLVEKGLMKGSA